MSEVIIYTDGACEPNPGRGGWAAILLFDKDGTKHEKIITGGAKDTTNNRMEITGVIEALKSLKRPCDVTIYSDSQYVVNSIGSWSDGKQTHHKGWILGWKYNKWRRKDGPLHNVDLWKELLDLVMIQKNLTMKWVRGHNGDTYNERCDILAVEARYEVAGD